MPARLPCGPVSEFLSMQHMVRRQSPRSGILARVRIGSAFPEYAETATILAICRLVGQIAEAHNGVEGPNVRNRTGSVLHAMSWQGFPRTRRHTDGRVEVTGCAYWDGGKNVIHCTH